MVAHFRRFVKDNAKIVDLITRLLKNDHGVIKKFKVGEEVAALVSKPVLAICETDLHANANAIGVGAILLQKLEARISKI